MVRLLVGIPILVTVLIIAIGVYLQPNNLRDCNGVITGSGECRSVDAIVAVSGGDTNARTDEAIRLYQNGWAKYLIFSGAAKDKTSLSNAAVMRERALAAGISNEAIFVDEYSGNTKENAENTTNLAKKLGIDSLILVTSGYHQRRASIEFAKRLGDVRIVNSPLASDRDWSMVWWTNPNGWALATSELVKIFVITLGLGS